jgi:hypothetical protein
MSGSKNLEHIFEACNEVLSLMRIAVELQNRTEVWRIEGNFMEEEGRFT